MDETATALATAATLERSLHERIPLSRAMGLHVRAATPNAVTVRAPLAPNVNHSGTVFGGSAAAVAVLAAWSLVEVRLGAAGMTGRIVIRRSEMEFLRPIGGEFDATASTPDDASWDRLLATLRRGRMGRITVRAVLGCEGETVGELLAEFAVLPA
ncbi:MAG TPA: YiiD C-terminal domain-containing protein [Steroidobacteraceae bacterium]|nr:YiiD C-terminal domain-containing protein [Steroidobacteraceae bacterium]